MKNDVKKYRQLASLTQGALAEKMKVSRQTIHAIESGKYVPSTVLALKLSVFLAADLKDLFQLEEGDM